MGTTLTAAFIRNNSIQFFQVGDSKGYISRGEELHQMTKDHSLLGQLVHDNVISAEDAEQLQGGKNIILKALGAEESVAVDHKEATLNEGDTVLLCSDGLHGCFKNEEMPNLVSGAVDVGKLCEDLVRAARDRGGPDNITVVLVTVLDANRPPGGNGLLSRLGRWFRGGK